MNVSQQMVEEHRAAARQEPAQDRSVVSAERDTATANSGNQSRAVARSGVCRAAAIALTGLAGTTVLVEAAVSHQLPGMVIIGLPDAALAEAKQRVRLATQQAGLPLVDRFILVNLSPAALPKQGSGFDLAIALSVLAASGHLPATGLADTAHIGELSLDGGLRRPPGLLSAVLAAKELGFARVMVPAECAREAALVPGIEVVAVASLRGAVDYYRGESVGEQWWIITGAELCTEQQSVVHAQGAEPDISEIVGQTELVEALVIAAAGRHHLSMVGPPGSGKTLSATRLAAILPDLNDAEAITASSIASLGNDSLTQLVRRPPFLSPHHTASQAAVVGGGDARGVRPGAMTRACHGVLFLDEAPEFSKGVLQAFRQPLESGTIDVHRAHVQVTLPAHFQLVLASNPCPCGYADSPEAATPCRCSPSQRLRYRGKLSGPLTDRIDLNLQVRRVSSVLGGEVAGKRTSNSEIREQVAAARRRAERRLRGTPWDTNGQLPGEWLRAPDHALPRSATAVIDAALARGSLTVRGYDRALRVAWTIADLHGKPAPERAEIRQALALRNGMNL